MLRLSKRVEMNLKTYLEMTDRSFDKGDDVIYIGDFFTKKYIIDKTTGESLRNKYNSDHKHLDLGETYRVIRKIALTKGGEKRSEPFRESNLVLEGLNLVAFDAICFIKVEDLYKFLSKELDKEIKKAVGEIEYFIIGLMDKL